MSRIYLFKEIPSYNMSNFNQEAPFVKVIHNLDRTSSTPTSVALGLFDGLHIGHQQVIAGAVSAKAQGLTPAVFTFDGSPSAVKGAAADRILSSERKLELLEQYGVEMVYHIPFELVRHMEPETFVRQVLMGVCGAKRICCGFNFRFGQGASADSVDLSRICAQCGIEAFVAPAVREDGIPVSATRLRELIRAGEMEQAAEMLGRHFSLDFQVVHGRELGRQMGTPTINQPLPDDFVRPKFGVYASLVTLPEGRFAGVTNVGVKPTVTEGKPDADAVIAETWIIGFDGLLYGRRVQVELLSFIRPEKKFPSLDALKAAILDNGKTAERLAERYLSG